MPKIRRDRVSIGGVTVDPLGVAMSWEVTGLGFPKVSHIPVGPRLRGW